jgi:hypothetical protein
MADAIMAMLTLQLRTQAAVEPNRFWIKQATLRAALGAATPVMKNDRPKRLAPPMRVDHLGRHR